jgi:hypothetical protein
LSEIKFLTTLIVLAITALILPTGGSYSKGEQRPTKKAFESAHKSKDLYQNRQRSLLFNLETIDMSRL